MADGSSSGWGRLRAAAANSYKGLLAAWKNEEAFRQEVMLLLLAAPLSFLVGESAIERLILIAVIVVLILVELLNSAIESVVDRVGLERHELSGRAKDQASAAVLLAAALAAGTWLVLLLT
ncbi:MAG: diacylglycerol kinase [Granulosicoccaceae bacterium]